MKPFAQILQDTAGDFLSALGQETVTYEPSGGDNRSISAIVNRRQPAGLDGAPAGHSPLLTIVVKNNAVTGISSSEINTAKDKVTLPVRIGQAAQSRRLTKILNQDNGLMKLEVR